jgi:hypothetical protein
LFEKSGSSETEEKYCLYILQFLGVLILYYKRYFIEKKV